MRLFTRIVLNCLLGLLIGTAMAQRQPKRDAMTYFQPTDQDSTAALSVRRPAYAYRLQTGDILAIAVSSLNADADITFNPFSRFGGVLAGGTSGRETSNNLPIGYRVSETGTIHFPKLNQVPVAGRTLSELETLLRDTLQAFLREPYVSVRLLNFKISVLGEVQQPSVFTVQNEKITLTEAISLAGDLTVYGKRENVLVVRETPAKREFIRVDLTNRSLFDSPAYYLKPNDMIYVEAKNSKKVQASKLFPYVPVFVSGLTLIATVVLNLMR
ncbi:EPS I polysaccharide export outer membrane protein epsA [Fibrella aestuarina BUZ 2]|uniref:EPS I polysaccharide export outer membrane protein epsA n=1 Tax=Fibrella aestuarina BUZ 2 TaxID=1166018 RepID=I0K637_9BACT|nr:polysaccharide biosynthesis/export family protein [Fibrella aestuarina]CCG99590.1 EPS I polysaccharide export outer membrane protein epsA [Fibrella aestuarina BUZ 2]